MPKFTFKWNSVPKLILGAELHRLVPKLFRAEVTRAEHRLPPLNAYWQILENSPRNFLEFSKI